MNKAVVVIIIALALSFSFPPKKVVADIPVSILEVVEVESRFSFVDVVVEETKEPENPKEKCTCGGSKIEKHDGVSPSPCRCLPGECLCGKKPRAAEPVVDLVHPATEKNLVYFTINQPGKRVMCAPCAQQEAIFESMKPYGWKFTRNPKEKNHFVIINDPVVMDRLQIEKTPAFAYFKRNKMIGEPVYGLKNAGEVIQFYNENISK